MAATQTVRVLDTVRTVIENIPYADTTNIVINNIQKWASFDSLIAAIQNIPSKTETIAQVCTAIGTIGTVVAAIGIPAYQKYKNRPIIDFSFKFDFNPSHGFSKYVVLNSNDEDGESSIDIFIGVKNRGRSVPEYPSTCIHSFFQITGDNKKNEHFFDTIDLKSKKKTDKNAYVPNGEFLFKVARIKKCKDNSALAPTQLSTKQPAVQQPAVQQPAVQQPAVQQPAVQQPAVQQPAVQQPAVQQPAVQQPAVQQPAAQQPAAQQPAAQQPAAQQPAAQDKYKVYLCSDGETPLGFGQFIIPIYFTSAQETKRTLLKILWASETWSISRENFCVEVISEDAFKKMENAGGK